MEIYLIIWVVICLTLGFLGNEREIGYWKSFLFCLLFSPIIGAIFIATSPKKNRKKSTIPINRRTNTTSIQDNNQVRKLNAKASRYKSKGEIDNALRTLDQALFISPNSPRTNFNIACLYSIKNNKENSIHYLERSIRLGITKEEVLNAKDLKWLKEEIDLEIIYISNTANKNNSKVKKETNKTSKTSSSNSLNYLDEIKELAKLRDQGILTEKEFTDKKREILSY